jgi:hypothetical protein
MVLCMEQRCEGSRTDSTPSAARSPWSYDLGAGAQGGISIIDGTAYVGFGGGGPPDLKPTLVGGITAFSLPEG